jgi:hypothetical protein
MAVYRGQQLDGSAAPYWVTDLNVAGGEGKIPGELLFVTVGGVLTPIDLAANVYLPSQIVVSDPNGVPVKIGDATDNAARVKVVGTINLSDSLTDSANFNIGVDKGTAPLFLTGAPAVLPPDKVGAARMSNERVQYTTGPPRESMAQGYADLTTAGEFTVLPAAPADIFQDLTGIWIYSTNATLKFRVFLRDSPGGPIRFPINIGAGGGSNNALGRGWNQTSPASVWTAQLDLNPAPDLVTVVLQAEKRTAS